MFSYYSPAKINLFLRIVSKELNGYHHLSSLFQTVSVFDTLSFSFNDKDLLTCNRSDIPLDGSNLVLKALSLFKKITGYKRCFKVHLTKNIPIQAGLGGGSSNAATTLFALNQIAATSLDVHELSHLGATLGSDVPFFFSLGRAHCAGRGEIVFPIPLQPILPLVIIKPHFGLPTSEVYRALAFCENLPSSLVERDRENSLKGEFNYFNDLEKAAFDLNPRMKEIKTALLQAGFKVVLMSGSGSSFFCMGAGSLPSNLNCEIFPIQTIGRSQDQWYCF